MLHVSKMSVFTKAKLVRQKTQHFGGKQVVHKYASVIVDCPVMMPPINHVPNQYSFG